MLSRIVNFFSDKQDDSEKYIQALIEHNKKLKREIEDLKTSHAQTLKTYRLKLSMLRGENTEMKEARNSSFKVRPLEDKKGKTWKKKQD